MVNDSNFMNQSRPNANLANCTASHEALLADAADLIQQEDLVGARVKYLQILNTYGESSKVLMLLGLLEGQLGDIKGALERFKRVHELDPNDTNALMSMAMCEKNEGAHDQAILLYTRAVRVLRQQDRAKKSDEVQGSIKTCFKQLCQLEMGAKRFDIALIHANELHSAESTLDSYLNLSRIHLQLNEFEKALDILNEGVLCFPNESSLFILKGLALEKLSAGMSEKYHHNVIASYDRAIELAPSDVNAYYLKANFLSALDNWSDAVISYELALMCEFNHLLSLNNVIVAYQALGKYEKATQCVEVFVALITQEPQLKTQLDDGCIQFFFNAGALSLIQFDYERARYYFEIALLQDSSYPQLLAAYLHLRMRLCDWKSEVQICNDGLTVRVDFNSLKELLFKFVNEGRALSHPFSLLSATDDSHLQYLASGQWSETFNKKNKNNIFKYQPIKSGDNKGKKIRIGYFSCDFKEHATAYLMASLFESHDKNNFEILAYSWGVDDKSIIRHRIKSAFDRWYEVDSISDSDLISLARSHQLDIAIDLKGYTEGARTQIFQARVAPFQVAYLGYPGTMNAEFIDYCIADEIVVPACARKNMSETILYMPNSYQANDCCKRFSDVQTIRADHGLAEDALILCCFNSSYKITPEIFKCWMDILREFSTSILWLIDDNESATNNLVEQAISQGVGSNRLVFASKLALAEHLERISHADLFLDTFPCNAHTTASDSLWAGVPVVTIKGRSFASRVAASLLTYTGLSELVTNNQNEYVGKIRELAFNKMKLQNLKFELLNRKANAELVLFDSKRFVKDYEILLKSIVK